MQEIKGKYNTAKVYATIIDEATHHQILTLCNQKWSEGSNIAIMPDCHAGAGCVIGTTMTIKDFVCPNVVGVDIGCGVLSQRITCAEKDGKAKIDLELLDKVVRLIPSGFDVWNKGLQGFRIDYDKLYCGNYLKNRERLGYSMCTLGGGNHFIELGRDRQGSLWLTVHTGSRNLGKQVAEYWQKQAQKETIKRHKQEQFDYVESIKDDVADYKIEKYLKEWKEHQDSYNPDLAFLSGENKEQYLNDMEYCQYFAEGNRYRILDLILETYNVVAGKNYWFDRRIESVHNYIDFDSDDNTRILRKGAVRAYKDEEFLVPLNMADGILICEGYGKPDFNFSAPHGAGRVMSRKFAKENISIDDYEEKMKNIYSTSVNENTLDEAPQAYKRAEDIIPMLENNAKIVDKIIPIYNYKAD